MKNLNKFILPVTATALTFGVTNCKSGGGDTTDKLVGQWEITDSDGDIADLFENDYDYVMNLEFHLEGDFEYCSVGESFKYCVIGEWEWESSKNEQLNMTIESEDGDGIITIVIDSFDGDVIEGEMTLENSDGEEYSGDVTLERVYVDKSALVDSKKK
jgi:hypothetical protein